jgi:hypothetical protein
MTTFFLGAGCSYGTLKDERVFPPIAGQFGKELQKRISKGSTLKDTYPDLAKAAAHLGKDLSEVGLEEIWTCLDYHAKFPGAFQTAWHPRDTVRQLKAALLKLYGRPCDGVADKLKLSDKYTLGRIVREMKSGDTLVSFNYDTVVERLFQKRGPTDGLRLLHCSGPPPDGVVRFAKPHGSASWDLRNLGRDVTDGAPELRSLADADALSGSVDPLLLGAVPIKSELIAEVQCYYRCHRVYEVILNQWRAVADAVRDSERLVVLGYSFPKEDTYGRFFFREAVRERSLGELKIEFFNLPGQKEKLKKSIRKAFRQKRLPTFKGEVKPYRAA